MTTKDEVKTLWKLCFNDSDEFTDLYFKMRYKDEVNRVIREDGKIISALQMIPYPMTFCDEVISTSYISGACTHPDYSPMLEEYYQEAYASAKGKHTPHVLEKAFSWHLKYLQTGSMK